jgi:hypothetical protein
LHWTQHSLDSIDDQLRSDCSSVDSDCIWSACARCVPLMCQVAPIQVRVKLNSQHMHSNHVSVCTLMHPWSSRCRCCSMLNASTHCLAACVVLQPQCTNASRAWWRRSNQEQVFVRCLSDHSAPERLRSVDTHIVLNFHLVSMRFAAYGFNLDESRGNIDVRRMFCKPKILSSNRSRPRVPPVCGGAPHLRASTRLGSLKH